MKGLVPGLLTGRVKRVKTLQDACILFKTTIIETWTERMPQTRRSTKSASVCQQGLQSGVKEAIKKARRLFKSGGPAGLRTKGNANVGRTNVS